MSVDIILISGPLEEVRHSGVVAVCKNTHILEILGEQVFRPVDRLGSRVLRISASRLVFAMKEFSKVALGLRWIGAVCPCRSRMALNAMNEDNTV